MIVDISKIYHTENGGEKWFLEDDFPNERLRDICYDGGKHVYAVGDKGIILRYTNPGLREAYAVEEAGKVKSQWGMRKMGLVESISISLKPAFFPLYAGWLL